MSNLKIMQEAREKYEHNMDLRVRFNDYLLGALSATVTEEQMQKAVDIVENIMHQDRKKE